MSLSSLIVQREIASIREIEEALARQVLYGGDFVTNLLEVSRIEESALMPVVAESFGLEPAPSGELPKVPEDAARLVAAEVAAERSFAPLAVGASLVVAVAEPLSRDAEQELTFALALPIEQKIAPLFRIRQALARDYGIPIDKRIARLITKVLHKGPKISSTFPPPLESKPQLPARLPSAAPLPPVVSMGAPRTTAAKQGTFVRREEAPPARPIRRRRGPLTADVANQELEASAERDVIFDILFEFARQFFDYTALFIVHGDIAEGRDAFGDGASRDKVARVGVPLDLANMLATARQTKKLLRTRPANEGLDPVLMADLQRDGSTECVVFPIIVRKRVVALLFGDGGLSGIDDIGVRQVEGLVEAASGAFERVIMRRKLKAGESGGPAEGGVAEARRKAESMPPPPTQVSAPPAAAAAPSQSQQARERPSMEEMAAPIRELMAEPVSRVATTTREPTAALGAMPPGSATPGSLDPPSPKMPDPLAVRSDRPPPANLLAVRRPSGRPIPREEPEAEGGGAYLIGAEGLGTGDATAGAAAAAAAAGAAGAPNKRTKSGSLKRAEAPPLEFGVPSIPSVITENTFGVDAAERQLIAEIQGQSPPPPAVAPAPSPSQPQVSHATTSEPPKTTRDPVGGSDHPWGGDREPSSPPHPWSRDPSSPGTQVSEVHANAHQHQQPAMSEAFSQAPYSPKAQSPPPMRVATPITDMSPQVMLPAYAGPIGPITPTGIVSVGGPTPITDRSPPELPRDQAHAQAKGALEATLDESAPDDSSPDPSLDLQRRPITTKVRLGPPDLTPGPVTLLEGAAPPPLDPNAPTPIAPPVKMTPDPDATPIVSSLYEPKEDWPRDRDRRERDRDVIGQYFSAHESPASGQVEPVLSLSQRKGHPPVVPSQPEPKPMPPSEQQVSVKPHKPPSSRSDHSRILPSVIVDVSSEYVTLVDRVLAGPDEDAETDLLRAGGYAMPAIMAKFPGPIVVEADRLANGPLPRVAECGPVIRLVASQRRTALPFVLSHVESPDLERRFWATYLLTELVYPDAIDAALGRVYDEDARVRRAARAAVRSLAEAHPAPVVERLAEVARAEQREPWARRAQAVEALGEAREAMAVPILLILLDDPSVEVTGAARLALVTISRQDFGLDEKKWISWWEQNKGRHRLEWLIDSLMHEQRAIRAAASDELKNITKEYFAYYDDLPKRERAVSQARYRDWWENIGRVRFSRASTRGA